uniref:32 kDa heat shock protein-like n=1 Tax=Erigeron canadensis TaxID=72917 RepID=UPI001CB8A97F|nr:32 kDa heat shock protein-like [Erigeron canadensis]
MVCDPHYTKFVKYANAHDQPIKMYVDLEKLDLSSFIEESDDECVNEEVKEDKPHGDSDDDSQDSDFDVDKEGGIEIESESESVTESDNAKESKQSDEEVESDSESDCPSLDHLSADEEELLECRKKKQNRKKGNAPNNISPNKGFSPRKQPMPVLRTPNKGVSPKKLTFETEEDKKTEKC